jgi:hypothetical protein
MEECQETIKAQLGDDVRNLAVQRGAQNELCRLKHSILIDYIEKKQAEKGKRRR